jgi:hypothetical protein
MSSASDSNSDIATGPTRPPLIELGAAVEVRARFDGRWCPGFEVADRIDDDSAAVAYRLRRRSDGTILPVPFAARDVIASGRGPSESH